MVDIQLASPAPTSATSPATTAAAAMPAVAVAVTTVPAALQDLTRTIQTLATPATAPTGNTITLITALGDITVNFAQQLSTTEKQSLTQQLMNLVQTERPLTLTLQPGSPPTQGTLLIPPTLAPTTAQQIQSPAPAPNIPVQPLAAGEKFSAIVLPSVPTTNVISTTLPQTAATTMVVPPLPANVAPTVVANIVSSAATSTIAPASVQPQTTTAVQQTSTTTAPQIVATESSTVPTQTLQTAVATPQTPTPVLQTQSSVPQPQATTPQPPAIDTQTPTSTLPTPATTTTPIMAATPPTTSTVTSYTANVTPPLPTTVFTPTPPVLSPIAALLTPGNEVSLHIDAVLPPTQNSATPALPALAPNQILATVSGTGTDGALILKSEDTTFYVKAQVSAPVGTSVIVSVDVPKSTPLLTLPTPEALNFQALPQAIVAVSQVAPQALQQMIANHIPMPTAALPGALLFLFSAFKQGSVRDFLGSEATDGLANAGKMAIINDLSKELSAAGQPAQDAVVGDWRAYPIPLFAQQQFQALTLYVHNDRDERKEQSGGTTGVGKIRFLIDMRLSKLGAMQVDGFVQPKKLDMILRSEAVLPEGLHHELRASYVKALGAVGYTGTLNFQVGRQHWLNMQNTARNATTQGLVT